MTCLAKCMKRSTCWHWSEQTLTGYGECQVFCDSYPQGTCLPSAYVPQLHWCLQACWGARPFDLRKSFHKCQCFEPCHQIEYLHSQQATDQKPRSLGCSSSWTWSCCCRFRWTGCKAYRRTWKLYLVTCRTSWWEGYSWAILVQHLWEYCCDLCRGV